MSKKKLFIWCSDCDKKVEVWGEIWEFRLSRSKLSEYHKGCYTGWVCDSCADRKEQGLEY